MADLRQQLAEYLRAAFGRDLLPLSDAPAGVQIGERVLYKVTPGTKVARTEPARAAQDELRQMMTDFAKRTGASRARFEGPVSSGLPHPRLIDLPGSSIMWDTELKAYVESDALLPSADFPLEWVAGVFQGGTEDMLLYLDFTHAKVKSIFRLFYDVHGGPSRGAMNVVSLYEAFRTRKGELEARCERSPEVAWAKLVQVDDEPLRVRIREIAPTPQ